MNRIDVQPTFMTKDLVESPQSPYDFGAGNFGIAMAMKLFGF